MRISDWSSDVCSSDLGILRIAQHANGLFRPRDFGAAARRIKVDLTKLLIDLRRCDALRLQLGRIQDHADFADYPSPAPHCGHAFYAQQTLCARVIAIPAQLFKRHVRRSAAKIRDGTDVNIDLIAVRHYKTFLQVAADSSNSVPTA